MKIKSIILALLVATSAMAEQRVIHVPCSDGKADTKKLEELLKQGWRVVSATAVMDSDSVTLIGKPKQAFTATIVFVIEKN